MLDSGGVISTCVVGVVDGSGGCVDDVLDDGTTVSTKELAGLVIIGVLEGGTDEKVEGSSVVVVVVVDDVVVVVGTTALNADSGTTDQS